MSLADLLARADAMFARHEAAKAPRPDPAPKPPRTFRIAEAKQGASWVAELSDEQRAAAGVSGDWKEQAVADLDALGGIPPPPPRRIGRPRRAHAPVQAPADLITELAGDVAVFDPFEPTPPAPRPKAAELPTPAAAGRPARAVQLAFPFFIENSGATPSRRRRPEGQRHADRSPSVTTHAGGGRRSRAGPGGAAIAAQSSHRNTTFGATPWTSSLDNRAAHLDESEPPFCLRSG